MENNLSLGNMISGGSGFGALDLQESMRVSHHQDPHNLQQQQQNHSQPRQGLMTPRPPIHESFAPNMVQNDEIDQPNSMGDYNKVERGKNSPSDEDEHSFNEDGMDGLNDPCKGKKVSLWHRVKWADSMVKLLITAVSYIGEDTASECGVGGRRKYLNLQKKGKWKSISKVMAERGFYVSPQQCEDKFNDLNKRYKKLNDILGRGTSCQVVENPTRLDMMDHLSEKAKDEVRKILSSKQLFYEEMCSYHNGNRLHLPHDPALQRSLQLTLRSRDDDTDSKRTPQDDFDEDDHDVESDDHEDYEENRCRGIFGISGDSAKRMKSRLVFEDFTQDFNKGFQLQSQNPHADMHIAFPEGQKVPWLEMQWLKSRSLQLEERKLQIEQETLELEKQRFKWERFNRKKDRELEKLKLENDKKRLENERMALELKRMEMTMKCNE